MTYSKEEQSSQCFEVVRLNQLIYQMTHRGWMYC